MAGRETLASLSALPVNPGLCGDCRHALVKETHRGTAYLRCGRAAWMTGWSGTRGCR